MRVDCFIYCVVSIALCIPLYFGFDNDYVMHMQFQETFSWITAYGIYYALGVDGISLPLIILTSFTDFISYFGSMAND